jgi:hypothetical protein
MIIQDEHGNEVADVPYKISVRDADGSVWRLEFSYGHLDITLMESTRSDFLGGFGIFAESDSIVSLQPIVHRWE